MPENTGGREWLRVIEDSPYAREKASRIWHTLGHKGRPQCPGCRRRTELAYLEFRNWDEDARFKIPHVMAMCEESAAQLLDLSRRFVFGVTAVGTRVGWPCAGTLVMPPEEEPAPVPEPAPKKESGRGKNPRSLANLIPNARWRRRPA